MASMATMATNLFTKPSYPSLHTTPKSLNSHFLPLHKVKFGIFPKNPIRVHQRLKISCGLIEPDGRKLVDLVVEESMRDLKNREALSLAKVMLSSF